MLSNQRDNRKIIQSIAFKAENTKACHQRYDGLRSRQMADVSLTALQYQVLSFVSTHPKAGRLAIKNGLADGETFVSEAALRTVLGELSSAGYLIVHRTKGGCEISELGRMVLEK